jgi:hypothetical protein
MYSSLDITDSPDPEDLYTLTPKFRTMASARYSTECKPLLSFSKAKSPKRLVAESVGFELGPGLRSLRSREFRRACASTRKSFVARAHLLLSRRSARQPPAWPPRGRLCRLSIQ